MKALHDEAEKAGVVLLNELGLVGLPSSVDDRVRRLILPLTMWPWQDPGIDHASAMQLIEEAKGAGNEVSTLVSEINIESAHGCFIASSPPTDQIVRIVLRRPSESRAQWWTARVQILVSLRLPQHQSMRSQANLSPTDGHPGAF